MKRLNLGLVMVVLAGCEDVVDLDPLDETPPVEARTRPRPITGGTLTVTSDGLAVAADPDRDVVYVVDVAQRQLLHTIALAPGDEPGRVIEGSGGLVHVALRGSGAIATLDRLAGTVVGRHTACTEPRGIAYVETDETLHVACAGGSLVKLSATTGAEISRTFVEPDLRDVIVLDGVVHVSTFRDPALLRVTDDPLLRSGTERRSIAAGDLRGQPHVAWRTLVTPGGQAAMLHQLASTDSVPIDVDRDELRFSDGLPYGGEVGGGVECGAGLTTTAMTLFADGRTTKTLPLRESALTVDAALHPDSEMVVFAIPGAEPGEPTAGAASLDEHCALEPIPTKGSQVTSVAFDGLGNLVMFSREPARVLVASGPRDDDPSVIELGGEPRFDTGHEIFHRKTDSGLSCASCHPEGTDDGHVWNFESLGKRRTQALDVGLADTAPFHWDGDMVDLDMIMGEVLAHRMGGSRQSSERLDSFTRWMFEQQRAPAASVEDPVLVGQGRALFETYGCATCHFGAALGGTATHAIAGEELQVPTLRRVSLHPPYMHDGRSATLAAAVEDMIEETTAFEPVEADIEAMSAYLRTL